MANGNSPAWQLSPIEEASGLAIGRSQLPSLPVDDNAPCPRVAFETVIRDGLLRPPCVVSFSGGRDSSAILAVAVDLAHREGHEAPIAMTMRFPASPSTDENEWQQSVIGHIGVKDWIRVDVHDELDLLGPTAQAVFARHGVLWPPNTHFHDAIARAASGGTLITGLGGDETMTPGWRWEHVNSIISRRIRPRPSDLARIAIAYGPAKVRRAAIRRRADTVSCEWLTPAARRQVERMFEDETVAEPVRFDRVVRQHWWPSRHRAVGAHSMEALASGHDAVALHPFADRRFLSAFASAYGRNAAVSRTAAMTGLVGDLLPAATLARQSKAAFGQAFWGPECRRFVESWDGQCIDEELIDAEALRRMWRLGAREVVDARTFITLQTAWVRANRPS